MFTPWHASRAFKSGVTSPGDPPRRFFLFDPGDLPTEPRTGQAEGSICPTSINFAGRQAGATSPPHTVTVENTVTGNLSFRSIAISGGSDFVVGANTCSAAQTPPGGNCTIPNTAADEASLRPASMRRCVALGLRGRWRRLVATRGQGPNWSPERPQETTRLP